MNTPRTYPLPGFLPTSAFATPITPQETANADRMLGKWMSEGRDLEVEVFKAKDRYAARIVWFDCTAPGTPKMSEHFDTENPDPALRSRPWLGMVVVDDLKYDAQKNEWSGGNIYDPNSGHTFRSVVRLTSPQKLVVRGYWGIEFFGKSLNFSRVAR
ncbi:uncharacterized protein (DUF2147 family) [Rhabdobacter roseus]|uniref:Uncharacterized protein (DUF2147 family) n=1 Tax=Rhabdobacter roseus TaxID=1655419 RepID=A0A840TRP0_9BACT|nr:DUF2147 domain-containing protein [Rhabdobacter roseus]MBB5287006.1 uncharacterized protein (DUF2147 family) [Rhabdobacter roseus]